MEGIIMDKRNWDSFICGIIEGIIVSSKIVSSFAWKCETGYELNLTLELKTSQI